jgi:hypothetical protein
LFSADSRSLIRYAWRALLLAVLCGAASVEAADTFFHSFESTEFDNAAVRVVGDGDYLFPETDGLRITIPKSANYASNTGIRFPMQLIGDFTLNAVVELIDVPQPSGGYGTGIAILLEDLKSHGASFQKVVTSSGNSFYVHHTYIIEDGKHKHKAETKKAEPREAVLQLERIGNRLHYRVSEDGGNSFRESHQVTFTDNAIPLVEVYAQPGGEANDLSVRIKSLEITAERFLRLGQKPPDTRKSSAIWIIGVLSVLIPMAIAGLWWYRKYGEN